jgi:hypothetical protein
LQMEFPMPLEFHMPSPLQMEFPMPLSLRIEFPMPSQLQIGSAASRNQKMSLPRYPSTS